MILIPNDRLFEICDHKTGVDGAFRMADEVLHHGVQAIAEVITVPGIINLDYADVRAVMKDAGPAWMSIGHGKGQNRAVLAAKAALCSPLLDVSVEGSKGCIFNIVGPDSLTLFEVNEAADIIRQAVDPDANVIFGVGVDESLKDEVRLTLIATGFADRTATSTSSRDKEITQLLRNIKTEKELEIPAFLRQRGLIGARRPEPARPVAKPVSNSFPKRW